MKSYTDLDAYQLSMDLVEEVYTLTRTFPPEELYGLTSQLRRAATSTVANIAEGFGRFTYDDKAHRYTIARGECTEVEAFLFIALRLKFTTTEKVKRALQLVKHVGRLLSGLIKSCKSHRDHPSIRLLQYSSTPS